MKSNRQNFTDKIFALRKYLLDKIPYRIIFLVTGSLATIWFLMRVIPKPSRAGYPCMQAAAPLMSGFVLYLLSFSGSFFAFRKARNLFQSSNYLKAALFTVIAMVSVATFFTVSNYSSFVKAGIEVVNEPPEGVNNPMGTGVGIFPGRVVWAHNPDATAEDVQLVPGDAIWNYENNDTAVIRNMVEQSLIRLAGTNDFPSVWDSIFYNHNRMQLNESRGYQDGEMIFIKINQGTSKWILNNEEDNNGYRWPESGSISPSWREKHFSATETGPFVVLNILRQLFNEAGVPEENIAVGDPMAHIFAHNFDPWFAEFPNVKYIDQFSDAHNRTFILPSFDNSMTYSDGGEVMQEAVTENYFEIMEQSDYMINVACLKPHIRAGITLTAKNHFGSITKSGAPHLHPSLVSTSDGGFDQSNEGYNKYRVMVDIMGHKYLGGNTMLFIIEGLFGGGPNETQKPVKYNSDPFNGDWANSILMSLDQVALESVCYDILRNEWDGVNQSDNHPNWLGVDDYLHQAADPENWPEGIEYNPDGEGPLGSLGVHEHWNNATDRQYSRNLGTGEGIELKTTDGFDEFTSVENPLNQQTQLSLSVYPNPFTTNLNARFTLDKPADVSVLVYDMQGRVVAELVNNNFSEGDHEINWTPSASGLKAGMYVVRMVATENSGNTIAKDHKIQYIQ